MKLTQTICPSYGARLHFEEGQYKTVCKFCGVETFIETEIKQEKKADYKRQDQSSEIRKAPAQNKPVVKTELQQKRDPNAFNPVIKSIGKNRRAAEKRNESLEGGMLWRALDFLLYLVLIVLIMFSIRTVLIDPVRVEGESMIETLQNHEVMLVNRTAYAFSAPKRGDIVICYYPEEYYTETNQMYATRVKRVIAVAGDRIELKNGGVYINGERLEEPYLNGKRTPDNDLSVFPDYAVPLAEGNIVPEGTVFVMGDNRPSSRDSRLVGAIPLERVVGKVFLMVYPFENLRLI